MIPIVFVDTETDGVHPGRKVWEVAIIRRDDQGQQETQFFVDIDLSTADPFGLKIGRFYDRHPYGRYLSGVEENYPMASWMKEDFKTREETAQVVARLTHGAHWVGAVPNFDTEVLGTLLRDHSISPAWHYHLIDVENLAIGYLQGKSAARGEVLDLAPPWNSDELMNQIGVGACTEKERHTALGDARWVMRAYDRIMLG